MRQYRPPVAPAREPVSRSLTAGVQPRESDALADRSASARRRNSVTRPPVAAPVVEADRSRAALAAAADTVLSDRQGADARLPPQTPPLGRRNSARQTPPLPPAQVPADSVLRDSRVRIRQAGASPSAARRMAPIQQIRSQSPARAMGFGGRGYESSGTVPSPGLSPIELGRAQASPRYGATSSKQRTKSAPVVAPGTPPMVSPSAASRFSPTPAARMGGALGRSRIDVPVVALTERQLKALQSVPTSEWTNSAGARAVASAQAFVAGFEYSLSGASHQPRKQRPLCNILSQTVEMIRARGRYAIQCIEATMIGLYLTQGINRNHLFRFGISFESIMSDGHRYFHIVLGVCVDEGSQGGGRRRWGAIGISRDDNLASRPVVFPSLCELLRSYELAYREVGHTLQTIKLGRPLPQGACRVIPSRLSPVEYRALTAAGVGGIPCYVNADDPSLTVIPEGEILTSVPEPDARSAKFIRVEWGDGTVLVRRCDVAALSVDKPAPQDALAAQALARFERLEYGQVEPVWYGEHVNMRSPAWPDLVHAFQKRILNPNTFWGYGKGCEPYRLDEDDVDRRRRPQAARGGPPFRRQCIRWRGSQCPDMRLLGKPPSDETAVDEFTEQLRRLPYEDPFRWPRRVWSFLAEHLSCFTMCGTCEPEA
eukprot:TRINITY_DN2799_c0_g2_i2.p1 TRINITY_DN2799_c0_g2~~TRINITY_DN2799_c0_g2_i2.p1  ORF type:complete len:656 (+),score=63.09 TRINITY_DN2799_c0_g2_i2:51-2018(+)